MDEAADIGMASVEAALDALRAGGTIVVIDDERRENEGDLIVAAEKATPESINFMTKHGRGLICIALERQQCIRLGLSRMSTDGSGDPYRTAFLESVDAREGVSTGISAHDRARTVEALIAPDSHPGSIVRPGHVFPLEAAAGGVLRRPGHTEAAVDLARLAGLHPSGVICEILREDGRMARLPELRRFAEEHGLPMVSIADLIRWRKRRETLVRCLRRVAMPTDYAVFDMLMYEDAADREHHLAFVLGDCSAVEAPLVRVHSECLTGDVFGSLRCDCGAQLRLAMKRVADEGVGAVLYLRQEGRGIGLAHKIHAYELQDGGLDTVEANTHLGFEPDHRDYGVAAQMLLDIGIRKVRLMTNNPHKIEELEKYGVDVVERVPIVVAATEANRRYLETKKEKMGHLL
jgi:3,4-dihydroxy 2-butanone 4-phosphate synthase / GTP cyclohydrolase II